VTVIDLESRTPARFLFSQQRISYAELQRTGAPAQAG
jgi:hypothetical protein